MSAGVRPGLLVKSSAPLQGLRLAMGGEAEPLFRSIGAASGRGLGMEAGAPQWNLLATDTEHPGKLWDQCHSLMRGGLGMAGAPAVAFAEPDLPQQWRYRPATDQAFAMTAPCGTVLPPKPPFPTGQDPYWFRDGDHSQFGAAAAGQGVRLAHLDTGYDPHHATVPARLRADLARNFVDAARPNDATDTSSGEFVQYGHGTATLALLAGQAYGAAPAAEVVPIRVANSVVLFSNSSIARGFDEVHRLCVSGGAPIDVVSISMGGLASQAWAEAINALYDLGVFIAGAAGNNYGNLPTRFVVYPGRFARVVAACGVMADHQAYADLGLKLMAGNYGPDHKMDTAMAAFTPNVPWARINCADTVDHDGSGTSSATPQIAGAAARWIGAHRAELAAYPEPWMQVEAVRHALFQSARQSAKTDRQHIGWGELHADDALGIAPPAVVTLQKRDPDSASFSIIRILTGLGLAEAAPGPAQQMLELEALQLSQRACVEDALDDWSKPPEALTPVERRKLADALASQPEASEALRRALGFGTGAPPKPPPAAAEATVEGASRDAMDRYHLETALDPQAPTPTRRRLRAYAFDPVLSGQLDGWTLNEAAIDIRWEEGLQPGPVGEYLEVVDVDPSSDCAYAPIDLNDPRLLARDGLEPNENNPQFHQQMVYAVAMKTIEHFERALGRVALWAPRYIKPDKAAAPGGDDSVLHYVQRLRIYPHALREENAFYSPERSSLLFGYFYARSKDTGEVLPGGLVFSCLSHDVVAHETTHALLDGLHRYYSKPTNTDALAFHEAFADIVALFQHFARPDALAAGIRATRGDLRNENILVQLAVQFGQGTGRYGALRDAIGQVNPDTKAWERSKPSPNDYDPSKEPHALGSVLVAAIFDGFLQVYEARSRDLKRLATGGTGVLPPGEIPADLTNRLAEEASRIAAEVLQMCIRALDYCPPIDLTFGEYLRALITADQDVAPETRRDYRIAMVAAFRARGIYPPDVKQLSVGSVAWEPPPIRLYGLEKVLTDLDSTADLSWSLYADRKVVWQNSKKAAKALWDKLMDPEQVPDDEIAALGLKRQRGAFALAGQAGKLGGIEVHSVRPARRIDADGQARTDLVIEMTQRWISDADDSQRVRGGCTLLFDIEEHRIRYLVRKRLESEARLGQSSFRAAADADSLRDAYFDPADTHGEPFAMLHRPG